ncbi:MAG TPA: Gfo/Idh/MocA family oxidoreductase [Planctomycetota bacterium]|jgi:predicted dehydrogenase
MQSPWIAPKYEVLTMNSEPHKSPTIALVGCGAMADSFHLPGLVNLLPRESIILVDRDADRASAAGRKHQIPRTTSDFAGALAEADGVILAVPHHLHGPMALQALERGVHVLLEKPMADSYEEAALLVALAKRMQRQLLVNNTRRLFPSYAHIKQIIESGTLGVPLSIDWAEGDHFNWPTASGFYFQSAGKQPRGVLLDLGAHAMDTLCWWLGQPPQVVSFESDSFGGPEATAKVVLQSHQCEITVRLSWLSKQRNSIRIRFERGTIEAGVWDWNALSVTPDYGPPQQLTVGSVPAYGNFAQPLLRSFIEQIGASAPTALISGADVLPSLSLLDLCYQSVRRFKLPWYSPRATHTSHRPHSIEATHEAN